MIKNLVYCAEIFIPKYKDEESQYVKGKHKPIVSEALFYDVQDVLAGRKRIPLTTVDAKPTLPLRGFIICPDCGKILTGSFPRETPNIIRITIASMAVIIGCGRMS